jgi:hypothetical protein
MLICGVVLPNAGLKEIQGFLVLNSYVLKPRLHRI